MWTLLQNKTKFEIFELCILMLNNIYMWCGYNYDPYSRQHIQNGYFIIVLTQYLI